MVPFFIAIAVVILAVAIVVVQALREKRARAERLGRRDPPGPPPRVNRLADPLEQVNGE